MPCKECIEKIIRIGITEYEKTTARLKDKPLCEKGFQLYSGTYICQDIKAKYHRPKRVYEDY